MFLCNQGVRELAKPPSYSEILHSNLKADQIQRQQKEEDEEEEESKGKKRKHESDVEQTEDSSNEEEKRPKERKIMKKAKNVKSYSLVYSLFVSFLADVVNKDSIFISCRLLYPWQLRRIRLQESLKL